MLAFEYVFASFSTNCSQIFHEMLYNKTIKCALHRSLTLTLFTQETLSAIGTEAHGLQRRLRDARCSVTAGVELAGAELAQPARVEWGALAKPVLRIAKRRHRGRRC